ncbi:PREDICTED: uncharacterized protein LOC105556631 [Vollenhovia emeryi]|uniref:uncharacterized protein LOC105556631 n=1 Tax=Vollenhovia emeryi TaxID=411798 RepID=UPI0005F4301A|nr:PREDICTED: uncharacterized protein LOC105556631 [Vollenhovia emeryi]
MVRKYKRKSEPRDMNNMFAALQAIKDGMSTNAAAKQHGIPEPTLRRHKNINMVQNDDTISVEEEAAIEDYMLHASDIYFGVTAREGCELAYRFAMELKKKIPTNWGTNEIAGSDWFEGFMRRYPKLSLRKPEATSMARAAAFNRTNVDLFFNLYEKVIKNILFEPHKMWNIDETGLTNVHKPNRVISRRTRKQVGAITSAERGTTVSMCLAVNVAGVKAPPYLVFPRTNFQSYFLNGGPPGACGGANPTGFMNSENFLDFIHKFRAHVNCSKDNPILLLLDNHVSHRTLDVLKYCRENGVHVLSFPHTSHRLQPLDVSVFFPFKNAANQMCADWVTSHPGRPMQIFDLPPIFHRALQIGATVVNIQSGFRGSGVYPFDRHIFQDIDFMPSSTTDRPYTLAEIFPDNNIPISADVELSHNRSQQKHNTREAKKQATEVRKEASAAKKQAAAQKKIDTAVKKALKEKEKQAAKDKQATKKKPSAQPQRINPRRKIVSSVSYVEKPDSDLSDTE